MRQFHQLFAGRTDAYGTYALPKSKAIEGSKWLGKARTITNGALTKADYDAHVAGQASLGIVPIMLDGKVWWFAIDIDKYGTEDLATKFEAMIRRRQLPLVVTRSKSGGVHIWCFFIEPIPAIEAREHAKEYLKVLGLSSKTEIFPKQETVGRNDAGNWINLPYYGNTRRAVGPQRELDLEEFLKLVENREVHPADLGKPKTEQFIENELDGAPPCIVAMSNDGIEEGGRSDALTHVAVFFKKSQPDTWQEMLVDWNKEHCSPPMSVSDVAQIIRSIERKDYQYLCKHMPMEALCDKDKCLTCKFGVGGGEGEYKDFVLEKIIKIDCEPPLYKAIVDGHTITVTIEDIMSFPKFRRAIFGALNKLVRPLKPSVWEKRLGDLMANIEIEKAPAVISTTGQVIVHFTQWIEKHAPRTNRLEETVAGRPFYDQQQKKLYFRALDLEAYIRKQMGSRLGTQDIWFALRDHGAEEERIEIGKRHMMLWTLAVAEPWFDLPTAGKF